MNAVASIFRIAVRPLGKNGWTVSAEYSISNGLPVSCQGPLNLPDRFEEVLRKQHFDPRGYGTVLGQAVFHGDVLGKFRTALALAMTKAGQRLSVMLTVEAPELMSLRWERLCIPDEAGGWSHLALGQRTPFSLEPSTPSDRHFPVLMRDDLRALVVLADPAPGNAYGLAHFGAAAAADGLSASLAGISHDILGPAPVQNAVGPAALGELCSRLAAGHASGRPYSLLHLVAHGKIRNDEPVVYLLDDAGQATHCTADEIVGSLRGICNLPHMIFLSSCNSAAPTAEDALGGLAQKLAVELGIPAVVAMTAPVSVGTATELASGFYPRLRKHGMPDLALAEAKAGMQACSDVMVPVLFSRLGGQPLFSDRQDAKIKPKLAHEPELVEVPAGPFWMGSDPAEGIPDHETPRHLVELPKFFISRTPVTCSQYEKFLGKTKRAAPTKDWFAGRPPKGKEDHPATSVSWDDAVAYCAWLSELSGRRFRLPSEAEWEKAARSDDGRTYPWGNEWQEGRCHCCSDATAPAGAFPKGASPYGCLGMLGNVREWTSTSWGDSPKQARYAYPFVMDGRDDPDLGIMGDWRVHRGGGFQDQPKDLRCAMRGRAGARSKSDWLGFRIVTEEEG